MARPLRIASFNLENLDDRPGGPPLAERIAILRPLLERLDADVLCLQELSGQPKHAPRRLAALDRLIAETRYAGFAQVATESPSGGARDVQNLAILSRLSVLEHRQVLHELVAAPDWRPGTADPAQPPGPPVWDRPALYAALDAGGGRRLHVLNLHLRAPLAAAIPGQKLGAFVWRSTAAWAEGFYLAAIKRAGQALEARLLVDRLLDADPDALIAVCGDLNAEAHEMPARILRAGVEDTGNAALARRELFAVEKALPLERRYSVRHAGAAAMLDHILVSRALVPWFREAEVLNLGLGDELVAAASGGISPESFHAPLVAAFELPD